MKALGFVVLAEGVMMFCSTEGLSLVALGYLVLINAIATGCTIALGAADDQVTIGEGVGTSLTAALTSLESRLVALESPLFAANMAKRTRKKKTAKRVARQLAITPRSPAALPTEDFLVAVAA